MVVIDLLSAASFKCQQVHFEVELKLDSKHKGTKNTLVNVKHCSMLWDMSGHNIEHKRFIWQGGTTQAQPSERSTDSASVCFGLREEVAGRQKYLPGTGIMDQMFHSDPQQ